MGELPPEILLREIADLRHRASLWRRRCYEARLSVKRRDTKIRALREENNQLKKSLYHASVQLGKALRKSG